MSATEEVHRALDEFRRVFASGDAPALTDYSETLVPREPGASISVRGRLILVLRREADGTWLTTLAMNSHSRPMEELEP
jgi:ketosteroid isomerase-like protein